MSQGQARLQTFLGSTAILHASSCDESGTSTAARSAADVPPNSMACSRCTAALLWLANAASTVCPASLCATAPAHLALHSRAPKPHDSNTTLQPADEVVAQACTGE